MCIKPVPVVESVQAGYQSPQITHRQLAPSIMLAAALLASGASGSFAAPVDAYKTNDGTVIVTGLQPTQRYQIRMLDARNKPGTRQDKSANRCGEVVVEKAADYITLVVGTETIDPAALVKREHVKCGPLPPSGQMTPAGVVLATPPAPR